MCDDGVYRVYATDEDLEQDVAHYEVPTIREYFQDLDTVLNVLSDGPVKSFAYRRLRFLESKFNMYNLLYERQELADCKVHSLLLSFV